MKRSYQETLTTIFDVVEEDASPKLIYKRACRASDVENSPNLMEIDVLDSRYSLLKTDIRLIRNKRSTGELVSSVPSGRKRVKFISHEDDSDSDESQDDDKMDIDEAHDEFVPMDIEERDFDDFVPMDICLN